MFFAADQDLTDITEPVHGRVLFETDVLPAGLADRVEPQCPNANPFYFNPTGGTGPITVQYDFVKGRRPSEGPGLRPIVGGRSWALRQQLGGRLAARGVRRYGESEDEVERVQNLNTTPGGINAALANPNPAVAFNPFGSAASRIRRPLPRFATVSSSSRVTPISRSSPCRSTARCSRLPGGSVKLAAGAEYREEGLGGLLSPVRQSRRFTYRTVFRATLRHSSRKRSFRSSGPTTPRAAFASLDLSIAGRYEEYSDFGDTFNPKFGVSWSPIDALTVHGSWGTSFRAPGLAENDPRSGGYGLYGDTLPCATCRPQRHVSASASQAATPRSSPKRRRRGPSAFDCVRRHGRDFAHA